MVSYPYFNYTLKNIRIIKVLESAHINEYLEDTQTGIRKNIRTSHLVYVESMARDRRNASE